MSAMLSEATTGDPRASNSTVRADTIDSCEDAGGP